MHRVLLYLLIIVSLPALSQPASLSSDTAWRLSGYADASFSFSDTRSSLGHSRILTGYFSGDWRYSRNDAAQAYTLYRMRVELSRSSENNSRSKPLSNLLQLEWRRRKPLIKKCSQAFELFFRTPLMNTYALEPEQPDQWQGGFLNPFLLEASWSWSGRFLKQGYFSFALATLRIEALPKVNEVMDEAILSTKTTVLHSRYGFSFRSSSREYFFNERLIWEHEARFFCNGLNAYGLRGEINNRLSWKFLKYLMLRADARWSYDPLRSLSLEFRHEFLLGVLFEHP